MNKPAVLLLFMISLSPLSAQSVGGGISFFIPESRLKGDEGNFSSDTSLGTSLGLGNLLSLPIGMTYTQVHGLTRTGKDYKDETSPLLYADALSGYVQAKVRLPLQVVYVEAFGGFIGEYLFNTQAYSGNVEEYLAVPGRYAKLTDWDYEISPGLGWSAGAGFGVIIDQINVGVYGEWREVYHTMALEGDYYLSNGSEATAHHIDEKWDVVLSGLKVGLTGNFSF